jgi:Na+/H+ ion antiporter subunit
MRRLLSTIVALFLAAAFYLLLIDTTDRPELFVLCGVALLCAAAFFVSRREQLGQASIDPSWLARAWRPVSRVPVQILIVSWQALAQLIRPKRRRGEFRAIVFETDGGDRGAGRRMLAEAFGSLAPNTIVVGIDRERNLLLTHQLRRTGSREELDVLDLG